MKAPHQQTLFDERRNNGLKTNIEVRQTAGESGRGERQDGNRKVTAGQGIGQSITTRGPEAGLAWVRFERNARFHRVYATRWGVQMMYCGRMVGKGEVRATDNTPAQRCGCCVSRSERAYLIPEMVANFATAANPARKMKFQKRLRRGSKWGAA